MPLPKRTSSDMFEWPVLTLKRGYNETDHVSKGGSRNGGNFANEFKQGDSNDITSPTPAQTAKTAPTGFEAAPSQSTSICIAGTSTTSMELVPALAAALMPMTETLEPPPGNIPLSEAPPLLSSTTDRVQTTPTVHPVAIPSNSRSRDNGLSPEEITIIVAVVVSFAVFLALLAMAIRCAILRRRRQHEARERARRIQEARRPPTSRLPPVLKKPSASSLRTAAAAAAVAGGSEAGMEIHDDDDNAEFRIVIRPPPGYRTPQSGASTPVYKYPALGSRQPSATTVQSPTVGRAVPTEGGQHWCLETKNGSIVSEPFQRVPLSRLNLTSKGIRGDE
ncbi:hypothetical protein PG988_002144 [Apiospora saccharicola]